MTLKPEKGSFNLVAMGNRGSVIRAPAAKAEGPWFNSQWMFSRQVGSLMCFTGVKVRWCSSTAVSTDM